MTTEVTTKNKGGRPTNAEVARRRALAELEEYTPAVAVEAAPEKPKTLEDLSVSELLDRCYNVYRIPVSPEMAEDKKILIAAIRRMTEKGAKQDFALDGRNVDQIDPGWAKIILHKEQHAGALNYPQSFGINGWICAVPRGIPVLVPIKIVDGPLKDAVETVRTPILDQPGKYKIEQVHVQPFQELGRTPGPDPRPSQTRAFRYAPRKAFRDKYGFWPSHEQLQTALKDQAITLLPPA